MAHSILLPPFFQALTLCKATVDHLESCHWAMVWAILKWAARSLLSRGLHSI